jgi:hypothetical protein
MIGLDAGDGKVVHGCLSGFRVDQWWCGSDVDIIVEPSRIRECGIERTITDQDGELEVTTRISGPISTYINEAPL